MSPTKSSTPVEPSKLPESQLGIATASFDEVFKVNDDGSVSPRKRIKVGSTTMDQTTAFTDAASFDGLAIAALKDKRFLIESQGDLLVIKGVAE